MGFRVINGKIYPVNQISDLTPKSNEKNSVSSISFQDALNKAQEKDNKQFVISNHAAERLRNRNISFNEADMNKINEGINKVSEKGANDCLILYKDVALITSIKNRTIITAVDSKSSKENVFTNIDSVVLL